MRLVKFGTKTCPACVAMDRSRLLERFAQKYPEVKIIKLDAGDEDGEQPKGSEYAKNWDLSEVYGVDAFPTLIFETDEGGELASLEGGVPMHELEKTYKQAQARLKAAADITAVLAPKAPAP